MFYLIVLSVILADQLTKLMILSTLTVGSYISVIPGFNLILTYNKGVSFSMFYDLGTAQPWILTIASLLICIGIFWYAKKENNTMAKIGLAMVLGGAFGNIIDRIRFGGVIDFLDLYYKNWHWPAFNIADSAICIGAILFAVSELFLKTKEKTRV